MIFLITSKTFGTKKVLIDDEDYDKMSKFTWCAARRQESGNFIIKTNMKKSGGRQTTLLHRFITDCPEGMVVDHINHNTLDNRKCNLRVCSQSENIRNYTKPKNGKTSKYKGVSYRERSGKFVSQIGLDGKRKHLGYYKTEEEAARAYNNAAVQYYGEFALLNVIEELGL